jgi:hypothetical protein
VRWATQEPGASVLDALPALGRSHRKQRALSVTRYLLDQTGRAPHAAMAMNQTMTGHLV